MGQRLDGRLVWLRLDGSPAEPRLDASRAGHRAKKRLYGSSAGSRLDGRLVWLRLDDSPARPQLDGRLVRAIAWGSGWTAALCG